MILSIEHISSMHKGSFPQKYNEYRVSVNISNKLYFFQKRSIWLLSFNFWLYKNENQQRLANIGTYLTQFQKQSLDVQIFHSNSNSNSEYSCEMDLRYFWDRWGCYVKYTNKEINELVNHINQLFKNHLYFTLVR